MTCGKLCLNLFNFQTKYDISRLKKFEEFYSTEIKEMPSNYMDHLNL